MLPHRCSCDAAWAFRCADPEAGPCGWRARHLAEPRARYEELMANKPLLDEILESGASKAREVSVPVLARVRDAIGIARR